MAKQQYRKGHFIVVEGTDGSGKATQVRLLRRKLQTMDFPHKVVEFPRYSNNPYGKLIGSYLRGEFGKKEQANSFLLSLAYAGDRFLAKPEILTWLHEGFLVIADRYTPSNKAYMAAKLPKESRKEFIDWLDDLEYNVNGIPREELTIFLYVDPLVSQSNAKKRGGKTIGVAEKHDIHESDLEFQKESSMLYLQLSKDEPNWVVIDCVKNGAMRTTEEIHEDVLSVLKRKKILPNES